MEETIAKGTLKWNSLGESLNSFYLLNFSTGIKGLCLLKWPSKTLQTFAMFYVMKTKSGYFHFSFCDNSLGKKNKVLMYIERNEKRETQLSVFISKLCQILNRFSEAFH